MTFRPRKSASLVCFATLLYFLVSGAAAGTWDRRWSGKPPEIPIVIAGPFWMSHWFWAGLSAFFLASVAAAWQMRECNHRRHRISLQVAVRQRTAELDSGRLAEKARNRILEMLVSNESLGAVLDATVRLIRSQIPGAYCAILLQRFSGQYRVGAALDFPAAWLAALAAPYSVPFEVWQETLLHREVTASPAWKVFTAQLNGTGPAMVYSSPIGSPDSPLGAMLICYPEGTDPGEQDPEFAAMGVRLARLAIEHNRLYDYLHFQAYHDSLTGLPNRVLFEDRLDGSLREAAILGQKLAVFFIDLDGFKQINDSFSHRVGDLFLCEIAGKMKKAMRPGDTIARIGGDEFTVLATGIAAAGEAEAIAARILHAIRQPVVIDGRELAASASVGIVTYPDDGNDAEQLLRQADAAMYSAKDRGRNCIQAFATRNDELDRVRMTGELRLALQNSYFVIHYQPKVGVDGTLAGLEALVRMNHPRYGQIPPASFIPVAEANGLIVPLGAWVLEEVCRQSADWHARGLGQIPIAVNVSALQISRPDFAKTVQDCLARHGVSPWSMELELTESLLIGGAREAQEQMQGLRSLGVRLSIDDFGTGYSSLSYLHRLQVDAIKLDKSFVQSIDTDELACRLVKAMVGVAQGLGLAVIAEGVETEEQRATLVAAGCMFMQGYLFARPMPALEVEALLGRNGPLCGGLLQLAASIQSPAKPARPELTGEDSTRELAPEPVMV